jgi:hypothetical protein
MVKKSFIFSSKQSLKRDKNRYFYRLKALTRYFSTINKVKNAKTGVINRVKNHPHLG